MAITTTRNTFVGFHTTEEVKEKLQREISDKNISMSQFIHDALVDRLKAKGISISEAATA